jgi:hypothetical protein
LKRKLWLLNFVLIAAIAAGAWRVRKESEAFQARERATLAKKLAVPALPPAQSTPPTPPVAAASYLEMAQKLLWSKDRNSQVIVDPPKPPDPPKPLPPLPSVHGVLNLGTGPIVMMSDKPGARQRGIQAGENIGPFKLVSVDGEELVLAFENRTVTKKLQELMERSQDAPPAAGTQAQGAPEKPTVTRMADPPAPAGKPEPGAKLTDSLSACQAGDQSPPGSVVNGMRKVVSQTPFGPACRWESIK